MPQLTPTELDGLLERINEDNFLIYAKLMNLQSQESFKTVIELLADNRINLSMIADLPTVNDQTIAAFVNAYRLHADPQILHSPAATGFNAGAYMEGIYDGKDYPVLADLIRSYNAYESSTVGQNRRKLVEEMVLTLDRQSYYAYNNRQEIKDTFQQKVLPAVRTAIGNARVESIFPDPSRLTVFHAPWRAEFLSWYTTLFGPFLEVLKNAELYRLLFSVDDESSKSQEFLVEFHELYNFRPYAPNLPKLFDRTTFELAALGRPYNDSELASIEASVKDSILVTSNLSESFSLKLFKVRLIELCRLYRNQPGYADAMVDDLETIFGMIDKFKKIVDAILSRASNSLKIIG